MVALSTSQNAKEAFTQLLNANGNFQLAAERAGITDALGRPDVDKFNAIIASESHDLPDMQRQIRTLILLEAYQTLKLLQKNLLTDIALLDADDLAKTFNKTLEIVANLTDNHESTQNVNIFEIAMRGLPPEAREAIEILARRNRPQIAMNSSYQDIISRDGPEEVN